MTCLSASNLKASGKQSSSALSCSKRIVFLLIPMVHSQTEGQL